MHSTYGIKLDAETMLIGSQGSCRVMRALLLWHSPVCADGTNHDGHQCELPLPAQHSTAQHDISASHVSTPYAGSLNA